MRKITLEVSASALRWGLGAGAICALLGVAALLGGALAAPIHSVSNAYAVALALFVRGVLSLLSLAMALTLAYYAGYQVESRLTALTTQPASSQTSSSVSSSTASATPAQGASLRTQAALSGALALLLFWFATALYITLLGSRVGDLGATGASPVSFTLWRLAQGIVYVGLGGGFGALGGRASAAHRLLRRLTTLATTAPTSAPQPPIVPSSLGMESPSPIQTNEASGTPAPDEADEKH
ncbi:MAG TPA: hypothetical protein VKQ36_05370 [Ktedonobacterales bacterium]|nr:hypothetical protein [Ktedonobacterales bacterium]